MPLDLDVSTVLQPFDGEFRGGTNLRESDDSTNAYRRLRDLRKQARDEELQSDTMTPPPGEPTPAVRAIWQNVWEDGLDYLCSVAKDLEIVGYMIEASIRIDGYGGLAQALKLTRELIDTFWGELLPTPDEDGIEATILPLARLNNDIITYPLIRVPLADSRSAGTFVYWQFEQARRLESMTPEDSASSIARGALTLDVIRAAIADTSDEFLRKTATEIQDAMSELQLISSTLTEKVGDGIAPSFTKFQAALNLAQETLQELAGARIKEPEEESEPSGESPSGSAVPARSGSSGPIGSRNQALDALERVAQWFEQHEPQSILPLEIRKAIRRAKMSPQELYAELIDNEDVRRGLYRDVGIIVSDSSG
jgi:type VI secretion system protein ImpA